MEYLAYYYRCKWSQCIFLHVMINNKNFKQYTSVYKHCMTRLFTNTSMTRLLTNSIPSLPRQAHAPTMFTNISIIRQCSQTLVYPDNVHKTSVNPYNVYKLQYTQTVFTNSNIPRQCS